MHMRFVRLKIREDKVWDARKFYEDRVLPRLDRVDGCIFASLLQGTIHGDEYMSMTVWTNAEAATRYEASGEFDRLLDASEELLHDADEWVTDLPGAGDAVVFADLEPEVEAWNVAGEPDDDVLGRVEQGQIYVRMVAVKLRRGAFKEFSDRFENQVRPALAATPGCLGAFLVAGAGDDTRVLSVTMWAREEDAVRYGLSGEFERLTARLKDTFSDLYQWNLALSGEPIPASAEERLEVEGYYLVVGRKL
jgi:heme-degrading monooxygenase HmoA